MCAHACEMILERQVFVRGKKSVCGTPSHCFGNESCAVGRGKNKSGTAFFRNTHKKKAGRQSIKACNHSRYVCPSPTVEMKRKRMARRERSQHEKVRKQLCRFTCVETTHNEHAVNVPIQMRTAFNVSPAFHTVVWQCTSES